MNLENDYEPNSKKHTPLVQRDMERIGIKQRIDDRRYSLLVTFIFCSIILIIASIGFVLTTTLGIFSSKWRAYNRGVIIVYFKPMLAFLKLKMHEAYKR